MKLVNNRIILLAFAGIMIMGFFKYFEIIGKNIFGIQTGKQMYPGSGVENFGKIDDSIYRGSYPDKKDYVYLKNKLGIKTVVDLTDDPEDWCVEQASKVGIGYINVPLSDKKYPTKEQVAKLEAVMLDSRLYPIFHHCRGNRHRGGIATGIYRVNKYGWDYERVYKEMLEFDWYDNFGHKLLRVFMKDYSESFNREHAK